MVEVARKPGAPLSYTNSRGVACGEEAGKVVSKALRAEITPSLATLLRDWQYGSLAGGGTDHPSLIIRTFLAEGRCRGWSHAVIFTDVRAAFYRAWAEVAVGGTMPEADRLRIFWTKVSRKARRPT